jgi:hypothetical protein
MRALKESGQSKSLLPYIQLIDFLRLNGTETSRVPFKDVIDTESNLSSEVLQKLLLALGIPLDDAFILKKQFIDRNLLKTRNEIAHGERTEVSEEFASEIFSQVESLLQGFKVAVENAAAQRLLDRRSYDIATELHPDSRSVLSEALRADVPIAERTDETTGARRVRSLPRPNAAVVRLIAPRL